MAAPKKKADDSVVRLSHVNGAAVTVSAERAEQLVAGGQFTAAKATRSSDK